eukprot:38438-Pyramimonas_sp.AAC.1
MWVSLVACTGRLGSSGRRSIVFNEGSWFGRPCSAWEQRLGLREVHGPRAGARGMRDSGVSSHAE